LATAVTITESKTALSLVDFEYFEENVRPERQASGKTTAQKSR
jgi:hypothetical protein